MVDSRRIHRLIAEVHSNRRRIFLALVITAISVICAVLELVRGAAPAEVVRLISCGALGLTGVGAAGLAVTLRRENRSLLAEVQALAQKVSP